MPEFDGFQVVRAIRERERAVGGHLPIIALTARSRKEDRERCLAAGMDEYLSKPVRAAELFAAIGRVVRKDEEQNRSASDSSFILPPSSFGRDLLDSAALLAACGDDAEGLRGLCEDFQAYAPARLTAVTDALRDRDAPRLREAGHKLCGLVSAFSTLAGNVAADLEEFAAAGRLDEATPLVARLEAMTRELIRQVDGVSLESLRRPPATAGS